MKYFNRHECMSKEDIREDFEKETGLSIKSNVIFGDVTTDEWEYNVYYVEWLENKIVKPKQR